jgi:hypothetical protein
MQNNTLWMSIRASGAGLTSGDRGRGRGAWRALFWAVFASVSAGCGGATAGSASVGGESHFLSACDVSCSDGLDCISGLCTRACRVGEASCLALSPVATCAVHGAEPTLGGICEASCLISGDCETLGSGYLCDGGSCRAPAGSSRAETGRGGAASLGGERGGEAGRSGSGPTALPLGLDEACALLRATPEPTLSLPPPSSEETLAALQGSWMSCDDPPVFPFAGFNVTGSRWQHLLATPNGFEQLDGFQHEGFIQLDEANDSEPGTRYQVAMAAWGWSRGGGFLFPDRLRIQLDGRLPDASLVHVPVSVLPQPLPFQAGERAGAAACAFGERGMRDVSASVDTAARALAGRWLRCSGPFPSTLEFAGESTLNLLADDGALISTTSFSFVNDLPDRVNEPGALAMSLGTLDGLGPFIVALSETPRKLYISAVLSDGEEASVGIYSAAP